MTTMSPAEERARIKEYTRRYRAAKKAAKAELKAARKAGDKEAVKAAKKAKKQAWRDKEAARKQLIKEQGGWATILGDIADGIVITQHGGYEWITVKADKPRVKHNIGAGLLTGAMTGGSLLAAGAVAGTTRTSGKLRASGDRARALERIAQLEQEGWQIVDVVETDRHTEWTLRRKPR